MHLSGKSSWSFLGTLAILGATALLSTTVMDVVTAAPQAGFCGDCQTYANAIAPCGVTFGPADIETATLYVPPQAAAKCICSDVLQKVLWTCAKCEFLAGHGSKSQPPQAYQTQCLQWGITIDAWRAPYTGAVAPGTQTAVTGTNGTTTNPGTGTNPGNPVAGGSGGSGGTGTGGASSSGVSDPAATNNLSGDAKASSEGSGLSGTAIGISLGIIGFAAVSGGLAVFMMKRSRRRHEPLDLDGTYVGLDDQWEKPRPQSPAPAAVPPRAPMQTGHRPPPFESRPGGGGSVVGGYDGQYDQYDQQYDQYGHPPGGYDAYNHGGYQAYPPHDYGYDHQAPGYDHAAPTSGPYHGTKGGEGGQYM